MLDGFGQTGVLIDLPPSTASANVAAGDSLFTGDGGSASVIYRLITTVTSPVAGTVSIDETPTVAAPAGYTFFGEQATISAPNAASETDPLVFVFDIDGTLVPSGQSASSVVVCETARRSRHATRRRRLPFPRRASPIARTLGTAASGSRSTRSPRAAGTSRRSPPIPSVASARPSTVRRSATSPRPGARSR